LSELFEGDNLTVVELERAVRVVDHGRLEELVLLEHLELDLEALGELTARDLERGNVDLCSYHSDLIQIVDEQKKKWKKIK
jgi:hypothetical protein